MFNKSYDPKELLDILLNKYKITPQSLSKITRIDNEVIINFANGKTDLSTLSIFDRMDFIDLMGLLSLGMQAANENERVRAVIQVLNDEFEFTTETIALYANLTREDVQSFLNDANSISIDKRYKLAVAVFFLQHICKKVNH